MFVFSKKLHINKLSVGEANASMLFYYAVLSLNVAA
jgi:hypothetical protein